MRLHFIQLPDYLVMECIGPVQDGLAHRVAFIGGARIRSKMRRAVHAQSVHPRSGLAMPDALHAFSLSPADW